MIFAFIGNDGSGKTTIIKQVFEKYRDNGYDCIYVEEFDYFILGYIKKLMNSHKLNKTQEQIKDKSKITFTKRILPYLVLIDLYLEYYYFKIFNQKTIILRDRYAYDFLMTWQEQNISNNILNHLYSSFPKPDLLFYINVSPLNAYNRRNKQNSQARSIEFYKTKTLLYQEALKDHSKIVINNNGSLNKSLLEVTSYINLKLKLSQLKSIAISGLDGSGKSTTIEDLNQLLYKLNIKHKKVHLYYQYLLLKLFKLVKGSANKSTKEIYAKSIAHEVKSVKSSKSKLWGWYVLIDTYIQYIFLRLFFPNHLIIFDRFFHDYIVSFNYLGVNINPVTLNKLFPNADRHFLQIADYKVLHKRKPEHTLNFFKKCYTDYMNLAKVNNLTILNSTNKNRDLIMKDLVNSI